jgi:hypothetical protein
VPSSQPTTPPPRAPGKTDPLLLALESKDAGKLQRFQLERLTPARLAALLPAWLASPTPLRAHLIRVPGLAPDVLEQAVTAWAENRFTPLTPHGRPPFPPGLLPRLTWRAAAEALLSYTRGHIEFEPPPTDRQVTDALFRVALEKPDLATALRENLLLSAWQRGLPPPETRTAAPNDEEARWIGLMAQRHNPSVTRPFTLALRSTYQTWPAERQRALAKPIGVLITVSLTLPHQQP